MLRSSTFCMLLAVAVAQSGYEYNKPGQPFGPTSSRPGSPSGGYSSTSGYQTTSGYPTTTPYPLRPQSDDYPSSTPGYPSGPSDYPTGPNQGYPGPGQRPQQGYPGQGPSYPGQGPSYPGQGPSSPGGYPGQSGPGSYPGPDGRVPLSGGLPSQNYPGRPGGFGTGVSGFGDDDTGAYEGGDYSAIPGTPDVDYPILSYIPQTSFSCKSQAYPGYYADVETRCQVFHVCANNRTYDFLCPNGTVFSQQDFVCVWWNQFECNSAPSLYGINANIYDLSSTTGSGGDLTSFGDYNQGPSYPGSGPGSYPGSGPQGPSNYPGSGPQGPNYPGGQSPGYPGSSTPYPTSSGPSYPGSTGYPSPPGPYPGAGPSTPYPGGPGTQGPNGPYPGGQGPSSTRPNSSYPGSGYPSGKPNGPSFPTGPNGRPPTPNREYLPPRN